MRAQTVGCLPGHVGLDKARGDGVRRDAETAQFDRESLGEALKPGLCRRVIDLSAVTERRGT